MEMPNFFLLMHLYAVKVRVENLSPKLSRALQKHWKSFPEGTRTRDGSLGRFHEGAAYIALSSGMTIIPTAIIGSYRVFPHSQKLPQARDRATGQRYRVTVCFCPEVQTAGRSEREITEEIRRAIAEKLDSAGV